MSDRDIARDRSAATTDGGRHGYDWGDPGKPAPRRQQSTRQQSTRQQPTRPPARTSGQHVRVDAPRRETRPDWLADPHAPVVPGRSARRAPARSRSPIPVVFLVLGLAGVLTFVAVGLGLGGVLFGGTEVRRLAGTPQASAAPCELTPDDKKDRAEERASGTSKPPDSDGAKATRGKSVGALGTTDPVPDRGELEDLALWVNPTDPAKSTVIGADKGCNRLFVYDLAGRTLQSISLGPITGSDELSAVENVDVRAGFRLGGRVVDVVVAPDGGHGALAVYTVNRNTRQLQNAAARQIKVAPFPYGVCMYASAKSGKLYAFVTQKEAKDDGVPGGLVQQWELFDRGGRIDARKVRELDSGGESEGCVVDDELGQLYVGNHEAGIFKFGAEPDDSTAPAQVDTTGPGGHLVADVEGLTIAKTGLGQGYLIASSQGNNSFAMYDRADGHFIQNFNVRTGDNTIVREIDGIDVTTENLGTSFPRGVFVVQADGQTFKLIPFQNVLP